MEAIDPTPYLLLSSLEGWEFRIPSSPGGSSPHLPRAAVVLCALESPLAAASLPGWRAPREGSRWCCSRLLDSPWRLQTGRKGKGGFLSGHKAKTNSELSDDFRIIFTFYSSFFPQVAPGILTSTSCQVGRNIDPVWGLKLLTLMMTESSSTP